MQQKRGISPLVGSVLLIAFVILIFVIVSAWIRRSTIEPGMEVSEEKIASSLEAMSYTS